MQNSFYIFLQVFGYNFLKAFFYVVFLRTTYVWICYIGPFWILKAHTHKKLTAKNHILFENIYSITVWSTLSIKHHEAAWCAGGGGVIEGYKKEGGGDTVFWGGEDRVELKGLSGLIRSVS
jgi:hypothetical protein